MSPGTSQPDRDMTVAATVDWRQQAALFDRLETTLYTAVVSDVLDSLGYRDQAMHARVRPIYHGASFIGRAHTLESVDVHERPADLYEMEIAAIDSVRPNDVVIAATNESERTCVWGELLSTATLTRGGRGALIDGHTRDVGRIADMRFPVFATGFRPVDSAGRGQIVGYGEPIVCGGVLVNPGDIVVADIDGVVVVPQVVEVEAIRLAEEKATGERAMRSWLEQGHTLREAYDRFGIL